MQVVGRSAHRLVLTSAGALLIAVTAAWADDVPQTRQQQADTASQKRACKPASLDRAPREGFEGVQIETSNIRLYEEFFETVLQVTVIQRIDHLGADSLRGYCYRDVLIVVRQDVHTPRPTGWVQINFAVSNAAALQEELEQAYRASPVYRLNEEDRAKIVRFRLKSDVMRGDRKAIRLEVFGPEGFMIGFDQYK